ncbi:AI-2E family transporter [Hoeflea ulvae]|uniref:AI-2E family transporter n=1 Tax=Hoeflea ulvae TaxID=2983764 RepID=A0ABT3YHI4_9HYPH|nr:AI-2E family transporter [Hoeflea ulvae]MCY0095346.1 AI-2E family transporter [Hoeflea ulvae]
MEQNKSSVEHVSFYLMLALITVAFCILLSPFYTAILWAVILAIIFHPVQQFLLRRLRGRKGAAALLCVLMCICLVIIPVVVIFASIAQEGASLYQKVSDPEFDLQGRIETIASAVPSFIERWTPIQLGDFPELRDKFSGGIMQASQSMAGHLVNLGETTLNFFIGSGIMLYLLFFLFRDGEGLVDRIKRGMPLSSDYSRQFLEKFTSVINATVRGNIIIAMIQGTIGGVTFWALGVEAALLWGVVMTFFSMLPAVGAAFIWAPAAVFFLFSGAWIKGVVLIMVGLFVIGLIDNLLRPPLVGKESKLPDYVVLISTVGGMALFGINGFIVGPLIAAMFISAWSLFANEPEDG